VFWKGVATDIADESSASSTFDDTVMVENGDSVGCDPDVALETGGAETQSQTEGLDGVLRGVCSRAPVGEGDRRIEERGQPLLLHAGIVARSR
jgi:hypothetical protein